MNKKEEQIDGVRAILERELLSKLIDPDDPDRELLFKNETRIYNLVKSIMDIGPISLEMAKEMGYSDINDIYITSFISGVKFARAVERRVEEEWQKHRLMITERIIHDN